MIDEKIQDVIVVAHGAVSRYPEQCSKYLGRHILDISEEEEEGVALVSQG